MADTVALHLLYVEDYADTAMVMSRLLESVGHDVKLAHTLAEARLACSANRFDMLICDIQLPDGDGWELFEELRATNPEIAGIVLSGYGQAADVARTRRAGFVEHLTKPVSGVVLMEAIQRAYAAKHPTSDPVDANQPDASLPFLPARRDRA